MSLNSHGTDELAYEQVDKQRALIEAELKPHFYDGGQHFADSVFRGDVSQDSITKVLSDANLYCENRWVGIPAAAGSESELYAPYTAIFKGLLKHGNLEYTCHVLASHVKASHKEGVDNTKLKSWPDFMFQGHNSAAFPPSDAGFVPHDNEKKWAFTFCASLVDIKTEKSRLESSNNFMDPFVQLVVYARQCFIQQQNRFFVYALILTEEHVRLYQFDRSGVQYSALINIHKKPSHFARILFSVASPDAEKVGFDPNVKWEGKCRVLYTLNENGISIRYTLTSAKPLFWRDAIRGRGTQCHAVVGPGGQKRLVKEAWRSKGRTPEWEFLMAAKGLAGVGQMVAYEETQFTTAKHRGIDISSFVDAPNPTFHDRIFSRVTLQAYGPSIEMFETRLQLLHAFRDAIAGHQNLWKKGILHRDISINNILLGNEGARPGNRGLVIDLDTGIWIKHTASLAGADFRTGTRAFQSVMVLKSKILEILATAHDYLDDLESFFYVLLWICCNYEKAKRPCRGPSAALKGWEHNDPLISSNSKNSIVFYPINKYTCPIFAYFGDIFQDLLNSLRKFFKGHIERKMNSLGAPRGPLTALMPQSEVHYAEVLGYIDLAIKAVEALPEEKTLQPSTTPEKRTSTGSPDDSPSPKKKKTSS